MFMFVLDSKNPITVLRSAAEAKPVNSPHPFRGAGRDEIMVEFFRVFKLDGPRLRRRPPPKNITKLKKNHVCKKTRFFIKNDPKVSLKVDPKIVKMVSRRLFICIYIGRFGRTLHAKTTGCGDGPPQASSILYLNVVGLQTKI